MKRVLYIAYFFPPLGGAGVQRTLKFVRYLPEHGWQATVVTGPLHYWLQDESLLGEVPPVVRVERAPHWGGRFVGGGGAGTRRSTSRIRGLRLAARAVLVPDAYLGWAMPAARLIERLLHTSHYDAVVTSSSPDSAHLLGRWIHRRFGLPWIADFRDPWTRRLSYAPPTPLHHALQRRMERRVLHDADRIVVTSDATREDFLALEPALPEEKIVTIENGYDEEDFVRAAAWLADRARAERAGADAASAESDSAAPAAPGTHAARDLLLGCSVLHAGQLNPERPLATYLEGLRIFLGHREGADAARARTLFLGGHYDDDVVRVERAGLREAVTFAPSRPHIESVAALLAARVLLLLEQDSERGALILPGKIFEYLRAARPVLAVVPRDGAAARLVRDMGAGWVADPADPASVAAGLERLLAEPDAFLAPREKVVRFERRALAGRLARELDSSAARRPEGRSV